MSSALFAAIAVLLVLSLVGLVVLFLKALRLSSDAALLSQQQATLSQQNTTLTQQGTTLAQENAALKKRLDGIADLDAERANLQAQIARIKAGSEQAVQKFGEQTHQAEQTFLQEQARLQGETGLLQAHIDGLRQQLRGLDEEANLQSFGFYKPRYDFATSQIYQAALDDIRANQKQMIKDKTAATCSIEWQVNGSRAEGQKQINQTLKLILRAFNGESDAAIAKVKYNNVQVMESRIRKAWEAVNELASVQQCRIAPLYLELRLKELYLAHEYQEKTQEEKEEQRRIREQMREEEVARREMERKLQEAEREEKRYEEALTKARIEAENAVGAKQQKLLSQIEELQNRLAEAQSNRERAVAQAQLTRSGHVYVISNIGSFGEGVYKIGMTRRLDPKDRVRELGDASVPFLFDIHAIIYSEDAPSLETALHRQFNHLRVNQVNERREFFRVSIQEIADVVRRHQGTIKIIEGIVEDPEAKEYRETLAKIKDLQQDMLANGAQPVFVPASPADRVVTT